MDDSILCRHQQKNAANLNLLLGLTFESVSGHTLEDGVQSIARGGSRNGFGSIWCWANFWWTARGVIWSDCATFFIFPRKLVSRSFNIASSTLSAALFRASFSVPDVSGINDLGESGCVCEDFSGNITCSITWPEANKNERSRMFSISLTLPGQS